MKINVFTEIYKNGIWGDGTEFNPLSGKGSSPEKAKPYVDFVARTINEFKITSVCDLGHGDWRMWKDYKFDNVSYIGLDVADNLSIQNTELYGTSTTRFSQITPHSPLPTAHLVLCKEVLQHLSNADIHKLLVAFDSFEYLIICNDIKIPRSIDRFRHRVQFRTRMKKLIQFNNPFYRSKPVFNNAEIPTGSYRTIDLESEVFSTYLKHFELIHKFDYEGGAASRNTKARVLFYKKSSKKT